MSVNSESLRPPSLAQHFDAPEDYTGHFGWLCGYSADALFLDDAAERFTRLTHSQRTHQGRIALAVLLDPGNPPISLLDAPGVAHLLMKGNAEKPFRLLHAKIALLGFRHQENHSRWRLRLLVSTGNWTRQTLEESLDLIWRIEVASESLSNPDVDILQNCADIRAAWELLEWIRRFFDDRLLKASAHDHDSETLLAQQQVKKWINACSRKAKGQMRFFDNRKKSLLSQLPKKIKAGGEVRRNYLAIGSGFYETSDDQQKPPEVPLAILKTLRVEGLLTTKSEVDLYVNPNACQSIATSLQQLRDSGITVRPAAIPTIVFGEGARRSLHAKFLFSANSRDNSNACTSAWVYLGSANLTHPGFANQMSPDAGNLEAGAVFVPIPLCWNELKNLLPIQWNDEITEITKLSVGPVMERQDEIYVAQPVAWLLWHESDSVRELRINDDASDTDFEVLDSSGEACLKINGGFQWREARPREVHIRWKDGEKQFEARIPVVDQYGRIAAAELPAIDIDEAWWQLAEFPMPSDDDEDSSDGDDKAEDESSSNWHAVQTTSLQTSSYPIRQMMEFIENIAARQIEIDEIDWALWCNRLEQTLIRARDSATVQYFREKLKLNPLSPLRHQAFRPSFADTSDSEPGMLYDEMLLRIEECWKVNELSPIGGAK